MLVSIIIALLLVGFTYRQEVSQSRIPGKPRWYTYRRIIGLLALILVPILVINAVVPEHYAPTPDSKVEAARRNEDPALLSEGYRELSELYPDSIELQLQYIDYLAADYHHFSYDDFSFDEHRGKPSTKKLLQVYAEIVTDAPVIHYELLDSLDHHLPYVHYVKALGGSRALPDFRLAQVESLLREEVGIYPENGRAYRLLFHLYLLNREHAKLDQLLQNRTAAHYLPRGYRNDYYFVHGQYWNYTLTIIEARFSELGLITLVAAFLVSFVWLVFLRSMDIFNREKWSHILLVFAGGAFFTLFCLPIYDFAQLKVHFDLNGSALNDFLYSFLVIGGGEELVKLVPWVLFALFSKRLREPYDYILYASVSALGFAFTENLMYLEDAGNIVGRSILSTVGHMFDASVVAYAVILAKYKFRRRLWKIVTPVIGFVLAALFHGFYDFWLISKSAEGYYFITLLFFIVSLHLWFFFKNNAMNNSSFFTGSTAYNAGFLQDLLTFSLLGMLVLEFVLTSVQFGTALGNQVIGQRALTIVIFLVYISFILHKITLRRGVWQKWRFRLPPFVTGFFRFGGQGRDPQDDTDFLGFSLRLFAPKSNPYIGDKLPKSGTIVKRITVSGDPSWYVFQFNTPLVFRDYVSTHIVLRNKLREQTLDQPKIEIYFMFIPDIYLIQSGEVDAKQLRYAGRAYSVPV